MNEDRHKIPAYAPAMKGDGLDNMRHDYILEMIRAHLSDGNISVALPCLEQLIDALVTRKLIALGLVADRTKDI